MNDTISRAKAIEAVMECYDNDELFEVYEDKLRELPPAQPAPSQVATDIARIVENGQDMMVIAQPQRIKGHWIHHPEWEVDGECGFECSECHMGSDVDYNFCMRCGADMRGTNK